MLSSAKTIPRNYALKPRLVVAALLKIRFNPPSVFLSYSSSSSPPRSLSLLSSSSSSVSAFVLPVRQSKLRQPINTTTLLNRFSWLNPQCASHRNQGFFNHPQKQKHGLRWIHKQSHNDEQQQKNKTTQPILNSTEAPPTKKTNDAPESELEAKAIKKKRQNLKETLTQYGASALAVHSVIYVVTLSLVIAGLHLLPPSTVAAVTDPVGEYFDFDIDIESGLFIAGYLLTATTGPARTIVTVVAAPKAAEHLAKFSYLRKYFKRQK